MSEEKSVFEKIIDREIPADIVFEDDQCICFRDIAPQAPVHLLVVPKKKVVRVELAEDSDAGLLGHLMLVARSVARSEGFAKQGFRLVINNGPDGGEEVPHLHIHVLAGRPMTWPPG